MSEKLKTNDMQTGQAEPFEETIEAFRKRVILKGGSVHEHYVFRKIDQLETKIADLQSRLERSEAIREEMREAMGELTEMLTDYDSLTPKKEGTK